MKLLIIVQLVMALGLPRVVEAKEELLQEIAWSKLLSEQRLPAGEIVASAGAPEELKIEHAGPGPLTAPLFTLEPPKITTSFYRVEGEVRYEGVEGTISYLEMWNHFANGGAYFSRTLGDGGPMGKLRGDSGWRPFMLPFNATGASGHPTKLVVNLQLAGKGTVYLRNVKVWQSSEWLAAPVAGAWWADRKAGLVGGIGGALIGCLGSAMEYLAQRGRARRFVLGTAKTLTALGVIASVAGLVALSVRQPAGVWYVLLLGGVLAAGIFPFRLRRYAAHYRELELRRMSALDAT
jgi:hypothetical protein